MLLTRKKEFRHKIGLKFLNSQHIRCTLLTLVQVDTFFFFLFYSIVVFFPNSHDDQNCHTCFASQRFWIWHLTSTCKPLLACFLCCKEHFLKAQLYSSLGRSAHPGRDHTATCFTTVLCVACLDDVGWRWIFSRCSTDTNLIWCQGLYTGGCTQWAIHHHRHHAVEHKYIQFWATTHFPSETRCFLSDATDHIFCLPGLWCVLLVHVLIFILTCVAGECADVAT